MKANNELTIRAAGLLLPAALAFGGLTVGVQGQGGGIPGAGLGVGEVGAKAPNAVGIGGDVQLPGEIAGRQLRGKEGEIDVLQLQLGLRQRLGLPWGDGGVQAGG